jgi:hypothetical protein
MEPITAIGLALSVAQVAEFTGRVFINLYRYYLDVQDAPARSAELRDEVGISLSLLNALPPALANDSTLSVIQLSALETAVTGFRQTLEKMNSYILPEATSSFRKLKWPFNQDKNARLIAKIERYKVAFGLALSIEQT